MVLVIIFVLAALLQLLHFIGQSTDFQTKAAAIFVGLDQIADQPNDPQERQYRSKKDHKQFCDANEAN